MASTPLSASVDRPSILSDALLRHLMAVGQVDILVGLPTLNNAATVDAVARAIRVVRDSGLPHRTDAMFTTIEGEWDECMAVVRQCCDVVAQSSPRVGLVLKADIRPGFSGELDAKLERLEDALDRQGDDAGA